jgi:exosortase D (VPLPA-CTERM-specific)
MSVQSIKLPRINGLASRPLLTGVFIAVSVVIALIAFNEPLRELVHRWTTQEEYGHGFFIPAITAWLLWARRDALIASIGRPAWSGPALIVLAALMHIVGELSAFFLMSQLGFIIALMGIVLCAGGYPLLRVSFIPLIFLVFAIPTPYFIDSTISWQLQLISSQLGVAFIRLFQIPVYLAGNIIDLGQYKLQVVEACSGLRYLYPLLSLGFLTAYLFQGRFWQRAVVFLSTIPITIVMNSVRIGITGMMVDRWGNEAAEGFLHFFEGWIIFIACAAILGAEIYLFTLLGSGKSFFQAFYLPQITASANAGAVSDRRLSWQMVSGLSALCLMTIVIFFVAMRSEVVPERTRFVSFPSQLGEWRGRASLLQPQEEHVLNLDDYIISDYSNPQGRGINFYVAYYASQRKGSSPHSPIVCLPGGGWLITKFERTSFTDSNVKQPLPFNRVIMEQDSQRQLVYYWFVQRGRTVANEYWSKWYLLVDAIFSNRTDGALIRLVTPMYTDESEQSADLRLQGFIRDLHPNLNVYLPAPTISNPQMAQKSNREE